MAFVNSVACSGDAGGLLLYCGTASDKLGAGWRERKRIMDILIEIIAEFFTGLFGSQADL